MTRCNRTVAEFVDSPRALRRAARIERIRAMQAAGRTNAQMAEALCIALSTLETFLSKYRLLRGPRA